MADEEAKTPVAEEKPTKTSAIPKGLLDAVKANIVTNNAVINAAKIESAKTLDAKIKEGLERKIKRLMAPIDSLLEKELQIEKSVKVGAKTVYIVHAGIFGVRKITL